MIRLKIFYTFIMSGRRPIGKLSFNTFEKHKYQLLFKLKKGNPKWKHLCYCSTTAVRDEVIQLMDQEFNGAYKVKVKLMPQKYWKTQTRWISRKRTLIKLYRMGIIRLLG